MDLQKTGQLLSNLRKEKGFTQAEIAEKLNISPKTVSKWECGGGFPDVSLLNELSKILCVNTEQLLSGKLKLNTEENGNMKKIKFYVCENCGSIMTVVGNSEVSCCGRRLSPLEVKKCNDAHSPDVEIIENDYYITFKHDMTKSHYISFVAYSRFDRVILVKLYPEQGAEVRLPAIRGGKLYFYCNIHGLFENS